jgi:hypothetical protein
LSCRQLLDACSINGDLVTMTSGTGDCTLTAKRGGNASYDAAPDVLRTVAASKLACSITVPHCRRRRSPMPVSMSRQGRALVLPVSYDAPVVGAARELLTDVHAKEGS